MTPFIVPYTSLTNDYIKVIVKKTLILITLFATSIIATAQDQDQAQSEQAIIANAANRFLVLSSQNKWLEAKPFVAQAYQLGQTIYAASDPLFGPIAYHFGAVQVALKEPSALVPLTQAKDNYEQNLGADSVKLIPVLGNLASAYILSGNSDEARESVARAVRLAAREYGDNSTMVADISSRAGREFFAAGDYKSSLPLQDRAHEIYLGVLGSSSTKTGDEAYHLSESFRLNQNRYGQVTFLKKAISSFNTPSKAESDFERTVHTKLVEAYHALGKPKRATKHVLILASSSSFLELLEPSLLVKANATYKGRGERRKFEGFVSLTFDVDANGFVKNIKLVDFEGDQKLVKLAKEALSGYRYVPTLLDGKPIGTNGMETKIIFKWAV
ncbi:MAG: tetratricopeptide (TPR) repeat protein [Arenicella sp.]|jgi:tetratricopeptide (TPR) repeat protein